MSSPASISDGPGSYIPHLLLLTNHEREVRRLRSLTRHEYEGIYRPPAPFGRFSSQLFLFIASFGIVMADSTSAPTKHTFIVYCPFYTDEGIMERRTKWLAPHFECMKKWKKDFMLVGGMMTPDDSLSLPPAQRDFIGFTLICQAESLEEVKSIIESDVYYTEGIWDKEALKISPFLSQTPLPGK
ncbi:hypothetical protein EW146_g6662 [Bondarzewia mesenterica]|uniref:YCII-related domain-containing protein n=1 Tax=Bondarzewia mesenterica TaxID=1095465 RepID=A0A4S4LMW8_9AGAM|nr:hypothetical protein EW146_g6662 [Bondarzewia mesenterica]